VYKRKKSTSNGIHQIRETPTPHERPKGSENSIRREREKVKRNKGRYGARVDERNRIICIAYTIVWAPGISYCFLHIGCCMPANAHVARRFCSMVGCRMEDERVIARSYSKWRDVFACTWFRWTARVLLSRHRLQGSQNCDMGCLEISLTPNLGSQSPKHPICGA
jgi:hypothetical protein